VGLQATNRGVLRLIIRWMDCEVGPKMGVYGRNSRDTGK
jgi:hypothetical protein